ncbi:MAG TPA: c-type cytochrome [Sphingobium sp.]|uniref:c-type cytochrome n=1 Tax=Sphingobium sp. TaxID=1912891 RepID=UPI002ED0CA98
MGDRFNTVAGWALFAGIIALGGGIVGSKMFHQERPEEMGYAIQGVEADGAGGGADSGPPLPVLLAKADVAAGEKVFGKCAACHTITQGGANGIGPNLYATLGEGIAEGKGGFAFSDALKKVGGSWDFDKMNKWLTSPRDFAPGTKMTFAGLGNPVDRANILAYINAQGSNLPLPKVEAAAAAAGGEGANAAGANGAAGNAAAPAANAAAPAEKK